MKLTYLVTLVLLQVFAWAAPLRAEIVPSKPARAPTRAARDFRGHALAQLRAGAPTRAVAATFSAALQKRARSWLDAALKKYPAPQPAAFMLLGSVGRGEALPGKTSSSDIDYAILTAGRQSRATSKWAARVHDELARQAAEAGFEFCHKLNGKNVRISPDALLSQSSLPFEAGNLFTGQFFGGSREVFADLLSKRADFNSQKDGDPTSPYSSYWPVRMRFLEKGAGWVRKVLGEIDKRLEEIEAGRGAAMLRTQPHFWKNYVTAGSVTLQNFAVAANLEATNTFDRIDEAARRGLITAKLRQEAEAAISFFFDQKARVKLGEPHADLRAAVPHLKSYRELIRAYADLQKSALEQWRKGKAVSFFQRI